ncbi:MAG: hypothetical protein ACSHW1_06150 [Yoonia sp.]|uniref:hypothetical protein n=1 Tax=Yoonia sp. TaxID=2212373 RepID=UPI003EF30140
MGESIKSPKPSYRGKPASVRTLEKLGREQLSKHFFMRDFLYSEIASIHGVPNIPDDPNLAVMSGRSLAEELLEPLVETFGPIIVRSAYRAPEINALGQSLYKSCASNEANRAAHIWDQRDKDGNIGASVSVVIPWFARRFAEGRDWRDLAWWLFDHLDFHEVQFFPKRAAFNLGWRENPERRIGSYVAPRGNLTGPKGPSPLPEKTRRTKYADFPEFRGISYPI